MTLRGAILSCAIAAGLLASQAERQGAAPPAERFERAYSASNRAVAKLEQFDYAAAAEGFREALRIEPSLAAAHFNLALALLYDGHPEAAEPEARAAAAALPKAPQPFYVLGLIAKVQNKPDEAIQAFRRVLEIDPADPGTNVNLAQVYLQRRDAAQAIALFRAALTTEPYNVTAAYGLATALVRSGDAGGQAAMQQFQALRDSAYGVTYAQGYLQQGHYAEAIVSTGAEPELVDPRTPPVSFKEATPDTLRGVSARDITLTGTASGGLDLVAISPASIRVFHADGGRFVDATSSTGLQHLGGGIAAVAGDVDNDGRPDLFVLGATGGRLLHQTPADTYEDVTAKAGAASGPGGRTAALVDVDHDGDLDIVVAGSGRTQLLRNNGNGTFTDITAAAGFANAPAGGIAIVPTDFDNHRDVDLLVVAESAVALFQNRRDGTFRDVAKDVGLTARGRFSTVAAGDVNKDGFTDFFLGSPDGPGAFALSDGRGHFLVQPAPEGTRGATGALLLDYDNDGLLDLLVCGPSGPSLFRNLGTRWADVTAEAGLAALKPAVGRIVQLVAGDIDGDGDTDIVARSDDGRVHVWRNDAAAAEHAKQPAAADHAEHAEQSVAADHADHTEHAEQSGATDHAEHAEQSVAADHADHAEQSGAADHAEHRSVRVQLTARVSNRSAAGAAVEVRAGGLRQKLETSATTPAVAPADLLFGLGSRPAADIVRVLWPSGILQAELVPESRTSPIVMALTELDRKPSSCPYLFTWNGTRFEFITDFLGGGEMGDWEGARWNQPDPDEYVRIRGDRLQPRDGLLEIRVTNELEEAMFLDRLQLVAVDHPREVEVYPNEGLRDPPRPPFRIYTTRGAHPPVRATDDHGRDVLPLVATMDRRYPDDFTLASIRGYAAPHALTLDLGPASENAVLLLTGWTDYAFSTDNVAAVQGGLAMQPPSVQVKDAAGEWKTVIDDMGFPVGRPQTVVVDLAGRFLSASREVRIVTNMRIYWDEILVDTSGGDARTRVTRVNPASAALRPHGFSAEVSPDGREPFGYDYSRVTAAAPWKVPAGRYTRYGNVLPLVSRTDDMFAIAAPGDEVAVAFSASRLPALPQGWSRTYLLYADGYSKEMNIRSATPDRLAPLPFHAMHGYPYSSAEHYPDTPEYRAYLERYNTRVVTAPVPSLEQSAAAAAAARR